MTDSNDVQTTLTNAFRGGMSYEEARRLLEESFCDAQEEKEAAAAQEAANRKKGIRAGLRGAR